jgi:outer membrane protein
MNRIFGVLILLMATGVPVPALAGIEQETGRIGEVLTLREAVRLALSRGPELSLAQAEAAKAGEVLREIRSINLPQIAAGSGLAVNNGFPLSIEGAAPSIVQLGLSQAVLSKKNKNLIREAEEESRAAQAGPDSARNGLAAKTALLYSELHQARQSIPLLEQQRDAAVKSCEVQEALHQAGRVRALDLALAKVAAANVEQQLLIARERVHLAESGLRDVTGIPEGQDIRTETPALRSEMLTAPVDVLFQSALEVHPGIREAESRVRAREFHVEAEKRESYPQIAVVGQYALFSRTNNYQDYFNRFTRNNYLLGLSVQVPLFNGFRTGARVAQSRREVEAARLRLQLLKSDLKMSLERDVSNMRIAKGAAELARLEAAVAEDRLKISEALAEAGQADAKELDLTRVQWLGKRLAAVDADRVLFERQVELLQSSGSLANFAF